MFKDLKDFTKCIPSSAKNFDITVEEMIDAPFISTIFTKNEFRIFKSNGEELSQVDIILNSMYYDIKNFLYDVHSVLKEKDFESCKFGLFYFPSETPRSITYTEYAEKYMLSYTTGELSENDILKSDNRWLQVTPRITQYKYSGSVYTTIIQYITGGEDKYFTASMLTGEYKRIDNRRTRVFNMEGIVLKTIYGNFKLSINDTKDIKGISDKIERDLLLKDFIRWYTSEDIRPINDTYTNIVSNLFINYINTTDISTRYSFEAKNLTPPVIGYVGDMCYDLLENKTVVEICKHNDIMKAVFKILLNSLRKPLKKYSGDILSTKDTEDFNTIVETIKTEVI